MAICIPAFAVEKVYFVYTDPAGTPLAMTNADGAIVWQAEYKPFGEIQSEIDFVPNNKKFVGKELDEESGLYYFGARYMEARIGRFVSSDVASPVDVHTSKLTVGVLSNPQGFNQYAYGFNNPYKNADMDGKWPTEVHNIIIRASFSSGKYNLGPSARDAIMRGSREADSRQYQDPAHAYMHGMRSANESPADAVKRMNDYISNKVNDYKMLLSKGKTEKAYEVLGMAMHPIMDSTSPSHTGFQVSLPMWRNPYWLYEHEYNESANVFKSNPEYMEKTVGMLKEFYNEISK